MNVPFSKKMCCYCLKQLEENATDLPLYIYSNVDIEHIALGLAFLTRQ